MNKKISVTFVIVVIILIAGFFTFVSLKSGHNPDSKTNIATKTGENKIEQNKCSKRAFDGVVNIKGWYVKEGNDWLLQISDNDLKKLPAGYHNSKVILADGSDDLVAKLKKSSEKNPAEITIKGVYFGCDGIPMVSVASGEEVFKKYLTQK
jgi:hypothetical protein